MTAKVERETIAVIKQKLAMNPSLEDLLRWGEDPRQGVQTALQQYAKRKKRAREEHSRLLKMYRFEDLAYREGYVHIAGTDEAGRGPVAGPVTVAAVILPPHWECVGLNDSKKLSPAKRDLLFDQIREAAVAYSVVHVSAAEIDSLNIYQAVLRGMETAVLQLEVSADYLLSDAMPVKLQIPVKSIIHGDALSASIAAASILAKVSRDRLMKLYAEEFPEYGFDIHKGYLTEMHRKAIEKYGPTPIHRHSFEPIRSMTGYK